MSAKPAPIYLLEVSLLDIQPRIWRKLLVESSITLKKLHDILQDAMGWTDSHLHQFEVGDATYSIPYDDMFDEMDFVDERRVKLNGVLPAARSSMNYLYDFGDSWRHKIKVSKVFEPPVPFELPQCVAGEGACPPEDCGGVPGFFEFVRVMADKTDSEHESMVEWYGAEYDSKHFDIEHVNRLLQRHRKKARKK